MKWMGNLIVNINMKVIHKRLGILESIVSNCNEMSKYIDRDQHCVITLNNHYTT